MCRNTQPTHTTWLGFHRHSCCGLVWAAEGSLLSCQEALPYNLLQRPAATLLVAEKQAFLDYLLDFVGAFKNYFIHTHTYIFFGWSLNLALVLPTTASGLILFSVSLHLSYFICFLLFFLLRMQGSLSLSSCAVCSMHNANVVAWCRVYNAFFC